MERLLEHKICLITGAGRGIGRAVAELFAELGATVYANDAREGCMDGWLSEAGAGRPGKIYASYFDITNESAVKAAVMGIKKESGRIDVLINNAGVEFNELIGMISRKNMDI